MANWLNRFLPKKENPISWLRSIVAGTFYRVSDIRGNSDVDIIKNKIAMMRALAEDSQISTALSYYATDATTVNTAGDIIWATADNPEDKAIADIVNALFKKWRVNQYARDHILELATIGNLYIPTTHFYREQPMHNIQKGVALDNNTIPDTSFDVICAKKIDPEDIIHLWLNGEPDGFVLNPSDTNAIVRLPESSVIHFALGGLLGEYTISGKNSEGDTVEYDVQFAEPLMARAVQPTQTLSLLEDAIILSSLSRTIKFVNVDCGNNPNEIESSLLEVKQAIEQQLSLSTASGDAQSFVNPQSPNNLIYIPKINGSDAISITDLNMADAQEADNKLLSYYQDKKLSVLGVPKEAMNFSSNEGLGGAGSVLAQRSMLYANALQRLETAYMSGWTDALNKYFIARNYHQFIGKFTLHMNPIITTQSTVQFEKRDGALSQANSYTDLLKKVGVTDDDSYRKGLTEILSEVFPQVGADVNGWQISHSEEAENTSPF